MTKTQMLIAGMSNADKRRIFPRLLVRLLSRAHLHGYEVEIGNSGGLAIELYFIRNGQALENSASFSELGFYWRDIGGNWVTSAPHCFDLPVRRTK